MIPLPKVFPVRKTLSLVVPLRIMRSKNLGATLLTTLKAEEVTNGDRQPITITTVVDGGEATIHGALPEAMVSKRSLPMRLSPLLSLVRPPLLMARRQQAVEPIGVATSTTRGTLETIMIMAGTRTILEVTARRRTHRRRGSPVSTVNNRTLGVARPVHSHLQIIPLELVATPAVPEGDGELKAGTTPEKTAITTLVAARLIVLAPMTTAHIPGSLVTVLLTTITTKADGEPLQDHAPTVTATGLGNKRVDLAQPSKAILKGEVSLGIPRTRKRHIGKTRRIRRRDKALATRGRIQILLKILQGKPINGSVGVTAGLGGGHTSEKQRECAGRWIFARIVGAVWDTLYGYA